MKKYLIKTIILIILFILTIHTPYSKAGTIHLDITSEEFLEDFDPNKPTTEGVNILLNPITNTIINVANIIIGIIQVIGGILCVISIAIFGFGMLASADGELARDIGGGGSRPGGFSPNTKMELISFGRSLLIGSVLLFSSTTLVKFILNVLLSE